jgi:hypothetical protein
VCCYKRVDRISTTIKQLKPFSSSYRILQFDRGWLLNEYETRKSRINGYRQKRNLRDRRTAVSKFASDGQTNRILIFSLPFRRKKNIIRLRAKKLNLIVAHLHHHLYLRSQTEINIRTIQFMSIRIDVARTSSGVSMRVIDDGSQPTPSIDRPTLMLDDEQ